MGREARREAVRGAREPTYDGKKAYDDDGSILEVEGEERETQVGDGLDSVEEELDGDLIY